MTAIYRGLYEKLFLTCFYLYVRNVELLNLNKNIKYKNVLFNYCLLSTLFKN